MGLTLLAQVLAIAALAYASGLFMGLSVRRGELGPLRPGQSGQAVDRPRRGRRSRLLRDLRESMPRVSMELRRYAALALLVGLLVTLALGALTLVLNMQAAPLIKPHVIP